MMVDADLGARKRGILLAQPRIVGSGSMTGAGRHPYLQPARICGAENVATS